MPRPRILLCVSGACAGVLLTAWLYSGNGADILWAQGSTKVGNPITGEGLPNPAPKVTRGTYVGHDGGHRHRPSRREHLGIRALRRGRGCRLRRRRSQLRHKRG